MGISISLNGTARTGFPRPLRMSTALTGTNISFQVSGVDSKENPNDIAAQFVLDHPDWEIILDDEQNVIFIASPFYKFEREENASSE